MQKKPINEGSVRGTVKGSISTATAGVQRGTPTQNRPPPPPPTKKGNIMSKSLRLPDGSHTTDVDLFTEEWDKLRKPFESLGFRVVGFDPYIALCDAETGGGYFQLPIYAAKKFMKLMQPVS